MQLRVCGGLRDGLAEHAHLGPGRRQERTQGEVKERKERQRQKDRGRHRRQRPQRRAGTSRPKGVTPRPQECDPVPNGHTTESTGTHHVAQGLAAVRGGAHLARNRPVLRVVPQPGREVLYCLACRTAGATGRRCGRCRGLACASICKPCAAVGLRLLLSPGSQPCHARSSSTAAGGCKCNGSTTESTGGPPVSSSLV